MPNTPRRANPRGDSDACRKRAVGTMKETLLGRERLAAARKREDDFLARAVERNDVAVKRRRQEEVTSTVPATIPDQIGGWLC